MANNDGNTIYFDFVSFLSLVVMRKIILSNYFRDIFIGTPSFTFYCSFSCNASHFINGIVIIQKLFFK